MVLPDRHRGGNTVVTAEREPTSLAQNAIAQPGQRPACPPAFSGRPRRQGRRRRPARARRSSRASFVGSDRWKHATRPRTERVQALGGAKNHMLVPPDADLDSAAADAAVNRGLRLGRRALHLAIPARPRVGEPIADPLVDKLLAEMAWDRRRQSATRRVRWSPRPTATRRSPTSTWRRGWCRTVVDGRGRPDADGEGFTSSARPARRASLTDMSVYDDEIWPGPVGRARRLLRRAVRLVNEHPTATHGDLHQRRPRARRFAERGRGRHGRHQRADPGP